MKTRFRSTQLTESFVKSTRRAFLAKKMREELARPDRLEAMKLRALNKWKYFYWDTLLRTDITEGGRNREIYKKNYARNARKIRRDYDKGLTENVEKTMQTLNFDAYRFLANFRTIGEWRDKWPC